MNKRRYQSTLPTIQRPSKQMKYGTAGYRQEYGTDLQVAILRTTLFCAVRSATLANKYLGVMITASHNPPNDNGVKAIDHNGEVLDDACELLVGEAVNGEDLYKILNRYHRKYGKMRDLGEGLCGRILIGRDTRESGIEIVDKITELLESIGVEFFDYGIVSTPQLHFLVRQSNTDGLKDKNDYFAHLNVYYTKLTEWIEDDRNKMILSKKETDSVLLKSNGNEVKYGFDVDTANGTAAILIEEFKKINKKINFNVLNCGGEVNFNCGADFVKTKKVGISDVCRKHRLTASFDGDSDRLVFYSTPFELIDGDAQCVFLVEIILKCEEVRNLNLNVCAVLSHYSNSTAIRTIEKKCKVLIAETGVKNFIKIAKEYDIGVYFEPNGHGSVHFSSNALKVPLFSILSNIFDPCIGDAFANTLFFSVFNIRMLYRPLPTRDLTVCADQLTVDSQNNVIEPLELKNKVITILKCGKGTGFVRKSGTEDLVRVHAEGKTQEIADKICLEISQAVYDCCNGKGKFPEICFD